MAIDMKKIEREERSHKPNKELLEKFEYDEILFAISKELVRYSDEMEMTQKDLAKKLNISQAMVSRIESGKYNFSVKKLVHLWYTLSTKKINFGERILKRMLEKVSDNYTYIYSNIVETKETKFNYNKNNVFKFDSKISEVNSKKESEPLYMIQISETEKVG